MNRSSLAAIEGLDNFCRGCLIQFSNPNELIQYTEKNRRLFLYSTGLQVKRNDQFTFQLCKDCYVNMKMSCKFRKLCRNSDRKFQNYITLKETQEGLDFTTFLKNNDDTFQFPYLHMKYSTPAHKREDDNESTCTSIRNFINDMLPGDQELPDTEARIVREVIAEEADILDDSLDSHWLQDDMSIDSDFNLDLSLSPFSSPRPFPTTPTKLFEEKLLKPLPQIIKKEEVRENKELDTIDRNLAAALKDESVVEYSLDHLIVSPASNVGATTPTIKNILFGEHLDEDTKPIKPETALDHIYTGKKFFNTIEDENSQSIETTGQCIIESFENVQGETEIAEDIFAETQSQEPFFKLNFYREAHDDDKEPTSNQHVDENIEQVKDKNGKITLDTVYYNGEEDLQCKLCKRKVKSLKGLNYHYNKKHRIKLITQSKPKKVHICHVCSKEFTDGSNFKRHVDRHEINKSKQKEFHCDICKRVFSAKHKIEVHMMAHMKFQNPRKNTTKKPVEIDPTLVCNICGKANSSKKNLGLHIRRHKKEYTCFCDECGQGFYRKSEIKLHKKWKHNSMEYSHDCPTCGKKTADPRSLIDHIRNKHTGEKAFKCENCGKAFTKKWSLIQHYSSIVCSAKRNANNKKSNIVVTETRVEYKKSAKEVIIGI
ncbi:unnamed protein product [Plutella xylostella]|uniref:(diamondback moth) hypothetical protein n=1 Tax=Plutella xylostella TaxID=51655 RepID=A0A8S4F4X9_PLUXY|nr:unnamed protein product [Plutella xylostella]